MKRRIGLSKAKNALERERQMSQTRDALLGHQVGSNEFERLSDVSVVEMSSHPKRTKKDSAAPPQATPPPLPVVGASKLGAAEVAVQGSTLSNIAHEQPDCNPPFFGGGGAAPADDDDLDALLQEWNFEHGSAADSVSAHAKRVEQPNLSSSRTTPSTSDMRHRTSSGTSSTARKEQANEKQDSLQEPATRHEEEEFPQSAVVETVLLKAAEYEREALCKHGFVLPACSLLLANRILAQ